MNLEQIYREESGRILATLIRLLGGFDLAEEVMQEAFAVASRDSDFQWKVVNDLVPIIGNDECVPQEHAEKTVGRDRVWFGHDYHSGLQ